MPSSLPRRRHFSMRLQVGWSGKQIKYHINYFVFVVLLIWVYKAAPFHIRCPYFSLFYRGNSSSPIVGRSLEQFQSNVDTSLSCYWFLLLIRNKSRQNYDSNRHLWNLDRYNLQVHINLQTIKLLSNDQQVKLSWTRSEKLRVINDFSRLNEKETKLFLERHGGLTHDCYHVVEWLDF